MIPTIKSLQKAEIKKKLAAHAFREELSRAYPVGLVVNAYLRHGQFHPTEGTVIATSCEGRISVRLLSTNRRGYNTIKRVHWSKVCKA